MLHYWKRLVYNDIDIVVWYIAHTGSSVLQCFGQKCGKFSIKKNEKQNMV